MRIIGPPSADRNLVLNQAMHVLGAHQRFGLDMLPALWDAGLTYGLDPVGLIAQSYKETAAGRFTGRVKPEQCNTAGIKVRYLGYAGPATDGDETLAHSTFPSWWIGARAHAQHAAAYAGLTIPDAEVVDPRYWLVAGRHWCEDWSDLGGRWAPSATYGEELETTMRRLQGRPA